MLSYWLQSLSLILGLLATKEFKQVLQNISYLQSSSSVVYLGARQTGHVSQTDLRITEVRKRQSRLKAVTLGEQTSASSAI